MALMTCLESMERRSGEHDGGLNERLELDAAFRRAALRKPKKEPGPMKCSP